MLLFILKPLSTLLGLWKNNLALVICGIWPWPHQFWSTKIQKSNCSASKSRFLFLASHCNIHSISRCSLNAFL